nr:MAG TPA: hypothetical protein [Caudoviricetes sp.]
MNSEFGIAVSLRDVFKMDTIGNTPRQRYINSELRIPNSEFFD